MPLQMNELKDYHDSNIIYCGFVEDIDLYFKWCDIFLNPLQDGGGIKTNDAIRIVFESGASLATIGSIAVKDRDLFLWKLIILTACFTIISQMKLIINFWNGFTKLQVHMWNLCQS